ncbi:4-hydroxybenzoate 3-monooxygenase [Arthrobacter gengyunqii]|uniref:4-hydroxybenzoate 3-monooxygenase n=1 Tax=Arthrobacter gengyunqii TaxID=2886940 RepID=A0A9X1S4W5_9MICC|nr:4-hydroxybenzoate 3-monooxygenase [Arthrobacter gengyunqii]MCC3268198.1 4-hydroxybenzoate 3-monooxygenase [Arthrobacter gengyunqii]UOY95608.1 4-hydroxybenzoate 3-monooxygenase [Arthrobacter gengyunqii]
MGAARTVLKTKVGIVGGGPAGLMLSHLLAGAGIESIVVEKRDYETIRTTHRAGILEHGSVKMLTDGGVSNRVLTDGHRHEGIDLRFGGISHRIDFQDLVGESVWLYPQNEVFVDLAAARARDGGDVRWAVSGTEVLDLTTDTPKIRFTDAEGAGIEIHCDILVGADGSQGVCRRAIPAEQRRENFIEYPFAWFGILTEAPPSAPELVYANSDRGFALISQRNDTIQRMYFQADPTENPDDWTEEQIWEELQLRVDGPDGFELKRGPIFEKTLLKFRSYVCEPLRYGGLFLAGDAGHTVPPTGAKGLNLALADVQVLFEAIESFYATSEKDLLDGYSDQALARVWRAQNFSYWMTSMLHTRADAGPFERKRALGELAGVVASRHGSAYLAEGYTGWPS